jgi:glycosyltransferase involved in cell wall biosynthesis
MIVGIDASNIRGGGGVTHLVELLKAARPLAQGVSRVVVWSCQSTLTQIEGRSWLRKCHEASLDKSLMHRMYWQRFNLAQRACELGCDVLMVPGGSYAGDFQPIVAMSQNLLPFEWRELRRYGVSRMTLKLLMLRLTQSRTFRRADGVIFLTKYAQETVLGIIRNKSGKMVTIAHGINDMFVCPPREQQAVSQYSTKQPLRILYVSIVDLYKHQWHVADAVAQLRSCGLPVVLDLVGPSYPPALRRLQQAIDKLDPQKEFINYLGAVPHAELKFQYARADLCLFASSCENLPNVLIEGMASGLPILCSNRGPMPEVLGDAGLYFNPEAPKDIFRVLKELIGSPDLRARLARRSFERAQSYSWIRCARETVTFISQIACNRRSVGA